MIKGGSRLTPTSKTTLYAALNSTSSSFEAYVFVRDAEDRLRNENQNYFRELVGMIQGIKVDLKAQSVEMKDLKKDLGDIKKQAFTSSTFFLILMIAVLSMQPELRAFATFVAGLIKII